MLCGSAEVLTLRLNIPHSESFCALPKRSVQCLLNLEFSILALCECQALFLLILLDGYFSSFQKFLHTHLLTSTLLKTGVGSSKNLQDPISAALHSLLLSPILSTDRCLVFRFSVPSSQLRASLSKFLNLCYVLETLRRQ